MSLSPREYIRHILDAKGQTRMALLPWLASAIRAIQ